MNAQPASIPAFPLTRSLLTMTALLAGGMVVAWAVLLAIGARGQLLPAGAGAVVALVAGTLALLPMHRAHRQPASVVFMRGLSGTIIRMFVTIAGVLVLLLAIGVDPLAGVLWAIGWYALLLMLEVGLLTRYFRHLPGGHHAAGSASDQNPPHDATGKHDLAGNRLESRTC